MAAVLCAVAIGWAVLLPLAPLLHGSRMPRFVRVLAWAPYVAGSLVCHQRADRSFTTRSVTWPVCGRCAGLYLSAAVGAVLMSVLLAHLPPFRRAGRTLLMSVAIFGITMVGFGLSREFLLSIALLAASGMADTVSVVIRSTLLQVLTPDHLLGRVSAVNAIFIGSSNEIGAFESGAAARLLGTVPAVVFGGLATLVVVGVTAVKVPALRQLKQIAANSQ